MFGQFWVTSFLQGIVEGECAVLAVVKSLGKLNNGGPVVSGIRTERVADDVTKQVCLLARFLSLTLPPGIIRGRTTSRSRGCMSDARNYLANINGAGKSKRGKPGCVASS